MQNSRLAAVAVALAAALLCHCGSSSPSSPSPPGSGGPGVVGPSPIPQGPATILAAGDIGECGFGAMETGALLDSRQGIILALGDLAYMEGSRANFMACYDPAWGRHIDRTRPVPGNHEYETDRTASAYYDYFGEQAGPRGQGWYAFNAGTWRIIALNSEVPAGAGSAQNQWLRNELSVNRTACALAYFHRPVFSSGPNGNAVDSVPKDLWRTLHEFGVDVILNGHDHMYERFGPQDVDGRASATGIREFIVGTGGAHQYTPGPAKPNSEVRGKAYGFLMMTLNTNSYSWEFVSNGPFRDSSSFPCH